MGSSDESSNESEPRDPEFTNPLSLAFMNLFGVPTGFDDENNSFAITGDVGGQGASSFANQIFSPESFGALTDQLAPVNFGSGQVSSAIGNFGDFSQELASTGFKTDIDPIRQQMLREFNQSIVPNISNQFASLGGGGQNQPFSDFNQATLRAGGDLFTNLGALDFQASEAAADRRQQGISFLGQLPGLESQNLALQEQQFDFDLLTRPGGQLLNFFNNLMGVTQPDPLLLGNISSGERDSFSIL